MKKESLTKMVEVVFTKHNQSIYPLQLTFFQIVYVMSGSGYLHINSNKLPYQKGNLMLLTPNDKYQFRVEDASEFMIIKFSKKYVNDSSWKNINCMEYVLYNASHVMGCVLNNKSDKPIVKHIAEGLLLETTNNDIYSEDVVLNFIDALIAIIARNLTKIKPQKMKINADNKAHAIIDHIQDNIYSPAQLRVSVIANKFGLSESYLGFFFKKHSGETLSNFISQYKLHLIEHKLKFSDMRINEIVAEFEFSDESHLNKFFKKQNGMSLTKYRTNRDS